MGNRVKFLSGDAGEQCRNESELGGGPARAGAAAELAPGADKKQASPMTSERAVPDPAIARPHHLLSRLIQDDTQDGGYQSMYDGR